MHSKNRTQNTCTGLTGCLCVRVRACVRVCRCLSAFFSSSSAKLKGEATQGNWHFCIVHTWKYERPLKHSFFKCWIVSPCCRDSDSHEIHRSSTTASQRCGGGVLLPCLPFSSASASIHPSKLWYPVKSFANIWQKNYTCNLNCTVKVYMFFVNSSSSACMKCIVHGILCERLNIVIFGKRKSLLHDFFFTGKNDSCFSIKLPLAPGIQFMSFCRFLFRRFYSGNIKYYCYGQLCFATMCSLYALIWNWLGLMAFTDDMKHCRRPNFESNERKVQSLKQGYAERISVHSGIRVQMVRWHVRHMLLCGIPVRVREFCVGVSNLGSLECAECLNGAEPCACTECPRCWASKKAVVWARRYNQYYRSSSVIWWTVIAYH